MNREIMKADGITPPSAFSAGYAREIVNPEKGTGLAGWGNATKRLSDAVLDDLMITCTAICDGDAVIFMFSHDNCRCDDRLLKKIVEYAGEKFGIPQENVILNGTHTHTGPATSDLKAPGIA